MNWTYLRKILSVEVGDFLGAALQPNLSYIQQPVP